MFKITLPIFILLILTFFVSCDVPWKQPDKSAVTIVFKHGKIAGDPSVFRGILERFEKEHPGIRVKDEMLPASTDEQHQFYVINLEGKSAAFDVLSMDVIWIPEFAKAGWLAVLSPIFPEDERREYFDGPMKAVSYGGKIYAIPWYIDAGLLYYRKDLLEKYGFSPPVTWDELVRTARSVTEKQGDIYGFIWQGKQYEGLVCNVLEYFWGNGGEVLKGGAPVIDMKRNVEALAFMRRLITEYKVSPALVTTAIEETTRHIFGKGRALFMRNWPYAWNVFQRHDSAVRGKVGICRLPSFAGHASASTLGGWQLGVNRYSRFPEAAGKFVRFMTSAAVQKEFAIKLGYKPTRKALYRDEDLIRSQPFIAGLFEVFVRARPRPVTPYYMMMSQVMQPEFSAAISGIKSPEAALASAQKQIGHILGEDR